MELEEKLSMREAEEERQCHQLFCSSINYEVYKDRNGDRIPGTCEWFLQHPRFLRWRDEQESDLLWVSADAGCGKSVLSKALVDEGLLSAIPKNAAICHFFFKNDSADQRSVIKALSALLHQLFSKKPTLIKHTLHDFRENKDKLLHTFSLMWAILEKAAADSDAGEIICLLDALDECEKVGRIKLIENLQAFYSNRMKSNARLKFLVTSRPYIHTLEPRSLTHGLPTISLAGGEETESISPEIDLVICAEVPIIAHRFNLDPTAQEFLKQKLLSKSNRTYLWLKMALRFISQAMYSQP